MGGVSSAFEVLFFFGLNYFELKARDALFGLTFSALLGRFPTPRLARSRKTGAPTAPRRRSTGISATPRLPTPPFIDYERESLPAGLERVPVGDRAVFVGTPKLACSMSPQVDIDHTDITCHLVTAPIWHERERLRRHIQTGPYGTNGGHCLRRRYRASHTIPPSPMTIRAVTPMQEVLSLVLGTVME